MYLLFDTETTGLPKRWDAPVTDTDNWPRVVQIAWQLHDEWGNLLEHSDAIIKPDGYTIPYESEQVHGISTALAEAEGIPLGEALEAFKRALSKANFVAGHNVGFDNNVVGAEFYRLNILHSLLSLPVLDTCTEATALLCQLPGGKGGKFKLPTVTELYRHLFKDAFQEAHHAAADVEATARCFFELIRTQQVFSPQELNAAPDYFARFAAFHPQPIALVGLKHRNLKTASENIRKQLEKEKSTTTPSKEELLQNEQLLQEAVFVHLHNHSQFSVLQATSTIKEIVEAASREKMPAVALTDTANLMGAFHFVKEINTHNKIAQAKNKEASAKGVQPLESILKPIIGCEFYVCENRNDKTRKDKGYQVVMLAKNKNGYHNLAKMASIAYTEGFYYVPRIDREVVQRYKEDIIVLTGNLYGEVPAKILHLGEHQAEEALLWWKEVFQDDLYLEIMRHGQEDEDRVNETLLRFSRKHRIKLVAANSTYYILEEDARAHDILLCVKEGEKQATPIGRGRGYRYGLPNQEYYFKSAKAMKSLFKDVPQAILTIQEILDKISYYDLARPVVLPKFEIPPTFLANGTTQEQAESSYLRHLTYEGASRRYPTLSPAIKERVDFELEVIERTGYPGYFLIVQDVCAAAREMGVSVGPGRGSAAGSVVAYALGITNIDPIANNLLFERFLNPDRVSLPDIDIDFDDEGRGKVIEYVVQKYGANQVAQIITYGTMAAKSSIRDTARVLDLPLQEADRVAKLIPNIKLTDIFGLTSEELRERLRSEDLLRVQELKKLAEGDSLTAQTIKQARVLEGSFRNTGIHACGVIITPDDITNFVPIATAKDSDLYVTQFDNAVVESAGLLKMDFLGLKTLTLIKDTVELVKYRHDKDLNPDTFPLDDKKTYELFQRGETIGIFQYESVGMQKYMRDLKPTVFADLVAMNALYRPGPIEYIPSFIRRKRGEEPITYDLPEMEEDLKETYGITVYQEQVMLLSQKLAGFTKGEADVLRKAMGKKIFALLNELKPKFLDGGERRNHPRDVLEKVWKDWEAFASYAFNKSHSTCYALIGYQTAYLKANYPEEYMAAVLSNNMSDIKQISFFLEECKRMGVKVLGPDVNESFYKFTVNKNNAIRFGMGAVKGIGKGAVDTLVANRTGKKYNSVFDVAKRVDLSAATKKAFESLALAGGFDSFAGVHRAQYFNDNGDGVTLLEKAIRFGAAYQQNLQSAQVSLFGDQSNVQIPEPIVPECEAWSTIEKLKKEKEVVGIYISGHPLDDFKTEMQYFCNGNLALLSNMQQHLNKEITLAGVVTNVQHRMSKNGKGWAVFTLEDYTDSYEFKIFSEEYLRYRHLLNIDGLLYAKVFIREGWANNETGANPEPRIQFANLQPIHDVMENYAKKLTIQLPIEELAEEKITRLKTLLKSHKGNHALSFIVYEATNDVKLHLPSRRKNVKISNELLAVLEEEAIYYKLN